MKALLAASGLAAFVAAGSLASPSAVPRTTQAAQVMVHCQSGDTAAFVSPQQVRIAVGDTIRWRIDGTVTSDTLVITLKDTAQRWPFTGALPRGRTSAATGRAVTAGTYAYAVRLRCRIPGGGSRAVVIDPDIIVE